MAEICHPTIKREEPLKDGTLCLSLDNIPLLTTLLIAPIVIRTKSLGAAIICGGTVFYILQEWL
ncbi:hypothetical protein [uncultured Acidaminococcus sp.]|uniref:hypothetical protein n=1 Tax=uncultured Acidaminococcus sp. TaxID=352152 RepID=UPI0025F23808|nr:hypothetical protein [uncultured Acidaminococcus sp.]